ncbi:MAG: aspartate--tRNA ligase [Vampirovibrionales bacterium]|nr:aspartate--tRNA ligase [Vampirovibrionales bacterium]
MSQPSAQTLRAHDNQSVGVYPAFFAQRTHFCGELANDAVLKHNLLEKTVTINGWVSANRDLGGITFVEVRDRSGIIQLVADPSKNPQAHKILSSLRDEAVITATGPISKRPSDTINPKLATGELEIYPSQVELLNKSKPLPFPLDEEGENVEEFTRLKYRYLDLRRQRMFNNLKLRHDIVMGIRTHLNQKGFLDVETPILIKTTPEGARDYLVPSRVHPGKAFALPQSPQLYKQLLMVAGFERYYQIARCFRDEDLRSDRQPEFTQLDLEMSFVSMEDVIALVEGLLKEVFAVAGVSIQAPFNRITWHEAMDKYGSDKPDLRFEHCFTDLTDVFTNTEFGVFRQVVDKGGVVKALHVPGAGEYSRKELDDLQVDARRYGAKGLAYIVYTEEGPKSPILKFMSEAEQRAIQEKTGAKVGDGVFFMADEFIKACSTLGRFRLQFADKHGWRDEAGNAKHSVLWVVDFPMFERTDEGVLAPNHHPFTSPHPDDVALLETTPEKARSLAYDVVYNGEEIGGGSIRIHQADLQAKIFKLLGFNDEAAREKFGFLLEAFQYGVPPHGGLALGLDRICALLANCESIREVIAFPKTNQTICPMTEAPGSVDEKQLRELHFQWNLPKPKPGAPDQK